MGEAGLGVEGEWSDGRGAWLDIIAIRREAPESIVRVALEHASSVVPMLVKLIHTCER